MTTEGEAMERVDHRGSGWTLWREVYGTFIGVLPLIMVIAAGALSMIRDNDRHDLEIRALKEADQRHEQQLSTLRAESEKTRSEILSTLRDIVGKIETLQIQVARATGKT